MGTYIFRIQLAVFGFLVITFYYWVTGSSSSEIEERFDYVELTEADAKVYNVFSRYITIDGRRLHEIQDNGIWPYKTWLKIDSTYKSYYSDIFLLKQDTFSISEYKAFDKNDFIEGVKLPKDTIFLIGKNCCKGWDNVAIDFINNSHPVFKNSKYEPLLNLGLDEYPSLADQLMYYNATPERWQVQKVLHDIDSLFDVYPMLYAKVLNMKTDARGFMPIYALLNENREVIIQDEAKLDGLKTTMVKNEEGDYFEEDTDFEVWYNLTTYYYWITFFSFIIFVNLVKYFKTANRSQLRQLFIEDKGDQIEFWSDQRRKRKGVKYLEAQNVLVPKEDLLIRYFTNNENTNIFDSQEDIYSIVIANERENTASHFFLKDHFVDGKTLKILKELNIEKFVVDHMSEVMGGESDPYYYHKYFWGDESIEFMSIKT